MKDPAEQVVRNALDIVLAAEERLLKAEFLVCRAYFPTTNEALSALDNFSTSLVQDADLFCPRR